MEKILISIDEINPYDDNHPPTDEGWVEVESRTNGSHKSSKAFHDEGIKVVVDGIKNGGQITPVAIRQTKRDYFSMGKKYERLDGFKRFMGCKFSGMTEIPCYICEGNSATPGMQFGQPMFEVEPSKEQLFNKSADTEIDIEEVKKKRKKRKSNKGYYGK